jgi:ligand-binding sensor domain-containing protein
MEEMLILWRRFGLSIDPEMTFDERLARVTTNCLVANYLGSHPGIWVQYTEGKVTYQDALILALLELEMTVGVSHV